MRQAQCVIDRRHPDKRPDKERRRLEWILALWNVELHKVEYAINRVLKLQEARRYGVSKDRGEIRLEERGLRPLGNEVAKLDSLRKSLPVGDGLEVAGQKAVGHHLPIGRLEEICHRRVPLAGKSTQVVIQFHDTGLHHLRPTGRKTQPIPTR